MTAIASERRRIPLDGAVNFRDIGGYATSDGRRLRWGRVFRSDSLAELSEGDVATVNALGLRTLCDLRGEPEREHRPNRPLPVATHAIGFMPRLGDQLLAEARAGRIGVPEIEHTVRQIYRDFVTAQAATFSALLRTIADADALPLVFHCTSGRDRTGFASALLLLALGVPRATVEADYALSNAYRRDLTFQVGGAVAPEIMGALTQAHPSYLAAAFKTIDADWGSAERYLRDGLGLDEAMRSRLTTQLLD